MPDRGSGGAGPDPGLADKTPERRLVLCPQRQLLFGTPTTQAMADERPLSLKRRTRSGEPKRAKEGGGLERVGPKGPGPARQSSAKPVIALSSMRTTGHWCQHETRRLQGARLRRGKRRLPSRCRALVRSKRSTNSSTKRAPGTVPEPLRRPLHRWHGSAVESCRRSRIGPEFLRQNLLHQSP